MTPSQAPEVVPHVVLRGPWGLRTLCHGDTLGRLRSATHRIDDPRISELHAMLTLRGTAFFLRGLLGHLHAGRGWVRKIRVTPGLRVGLAEGVEIEIVEIRLPTELRTLQVGDRRVVLDRPAWSLLSDGELVPGTHPDALGWLWRTDDEWHLAAPGAEPQVVDPERPLTVDGFTITWGQVPVGSATGFHDSTLGGGSALPPITVICREEDTEIVVEGLDRSRLVGRPHDLVRTVACLAPPGGTVHWRRVTEALWPAQPNPRANWDRSLGVLRKQLRERMLPQELFRVDQGQAGLGLREEDTLDLRDTHLEP